MDRRNRQHGGDLYFRVGCARKIQRNSALDKNRKEGKTGYRTDRKQEPKISSWRSMTTDNF